MGINRKRTVEDWIFDTINHIIMILVFITMLYPIIYVFSCSVSDPHFVQRQEIFLFPKGFSLDSYIFLFKNSDILKYFRNSIFYTAFGTFISICLTVCGAFVLSHKNFSCRNFFMMMITFTMYFSGGLIPLFLLITKLKLYNTIWAILLPSAISTMNIIITRSFFKSIPEALIQSAEIDNANDFQVLFYIILPLSAPIVAVLILFYAVARWNSYFDAMIYTPNPDLHPLQLYLVRILVENNSQSNALLNAPMVNSKSLTSIQLKYSAIITTIMPIVCLYPFLQKYL